MSTFDPLDVHAIYNLLIEVIFGEAAFEPLKPYVSPHLTLFGTAEHERISGIDAFEQLVNKQTREMAGMSLNYELQNTVSDTGFADGKAYLLVQEIMVHFVDIEHSILFRLSTIWEKPDDYWMLFHAHSSTPDQNISEREAWPVEGILQRNRELEEKIAEKTEDLRLSLENLKATQKQLIHSEKMASLGELTAGIAHEIQNPLNFVNNFSEVSNELIDEAEQEINKGDLNETKIILSDLKQNINKISHHGQRASNIVNGMLDHSRNNSGEKIITDINALCEEYLRLAFQGMRAKNKTFNVAFKTFLDAGLPKVKIVPQDIGRVLLNLFNNAFQALNETEKPEVTIVTRKKSGTIEIIVSDNGPGIPDEIKDKIFQPFFTTKPAGQGTGLGLSLSYDILKAHGGELTVISKEENGSEFVIQLPFQ